MDKKTLINQIGIYAGIIVLFLVLAYAFVPQVLEGKIVYQSDIVGYIGMSHESDVYNAEHPHDPTRWTNAMFSGMPTTSFQISGKGDWIQSIYRFLMLGKRPANWLFISLVGAFLLMLSLGIGKVVAIGGAVAVTFCSYNLQIIQVGHNTKMQALAFLPWVLAAMIFTYRAALQYSRPAQNEEENVHDGTNGKGIRRWWPMTALGAALFALFLSLQLKANHQQISYYLAIVIVIYALTVFIWLLCSRERRRLLSRFFAASALLLTLGLIGIGTNAIKLAPLYEYTRHTMRGGSELKDQTEKKVSGKGLQLDYATAWSYGWQELPNLMIPNFNGGSSAGGINPNNSEVVKLFKQAGQKNLDDIAKSLPLYWGPQPFTAGPMHIGAITVFLFVLGLCLYKGKEKWWLLAATLVATFLSLGSHFIGFTKLFYHYAPMYSKFRTVSMALVILQFTLPMLGFLVLDRILKGEYTKEDFKKRGLVALALTAGFCLLCILAPGIAGSFTRSSDASLQDAIAEALRADRKQLFVKDALGAMLLILATYALLWWRYSVPKDKKKAASRPLLAALGIGLLVCANLFSVGKRYLNARSFTTKNSFSNEFAARPVDKRILEDPEPSYRVVDLTSDVFNDSHASYWHKSIGGYSPAKLQRYQDIIEKYLIGELQSLYKVLNEAVTLEEVQARMPVLPMISALNGKYFILMADGTPIVNKAALGNAWFVDSLVNAATPAEEIEKIGQVDLGGTMVIGEDFKEAREKVADILSTPSSGGTLPDTIQMTSCTPNELHYRYRLSSSRPVVFSEIYYPDGWHAWLADKSAGPVPLFRVNWLLRGAILPAGEHELVMRFDPEVYSMGEKVSRASSIALVFLLLLTVCGAILASPAVFKHS